MESLQLYLDMLLALFQLLLVIWPIWVILGIPWAIRIALKLYESYRLSKAGMLEIDKMSGKDFEKFLAVLFRKLGYKVKRTPYRGDYGADLVIKKGGEKTVVQAKRYKKYVGVKAIQEAVASKEYYRCDKAMVVTNSQYTQQAKRLAQANNVELWNRKKLINTLLAVKKGIKAASAKSSLPTDDMVSIIQNSIATSLDQNICHICLKSVTQKVKDYCLAHQDIFEGKVYCYDHQKEIRKNRMTSSR